jgi:lysophospholipase L1-like esterase
MWMTFGLLVALGDSITYGFGLARPSTQNYAAQFAAHAHDRIVNLARPGYDCTDVLKREVPKLPAGATTVILNCGTNDIGGFDLTASGLPDGHKRAVPAGPRDMHAAEGSFSRIVAQIRRRDPSAQIIIVTVRHWQRMTGPEDPRFAADVDAWNRYVRLDGVRVVDIAADPRMYLSENFREDLLHPNLAGHDAITGDFLR